MILLIHLFHLRHWFCCMNNKDFLNIWSHVLHLCAHMAFLEHGSSLKKNKKNFKQELIRFLPSSRFRVDSFSSEFSWRGQRIPIRLECEWDQLFLAYLKGLSGSTWQGFWMCSLIHKEKDLIYNIWTVWWFFVQIIKKEPHHELQVEAAGFLNAPCAQRPGKKEKNNLNTILNFIYIS